MKRREFLKLSSAAASLAIVPRHVLGGPGHTPPSEKLNIAGIGIGGQGGGDLREMATENIVALCDVDWKFAAGTLQHLSQGPAVSRLPADAGQVPRHRGRDDCHAGPHARPHHAGRAAGRETCERRKADGPLD